jgi:hypothetical protein
MESLRETNSHTKERDGIDSNMIPNELVVDETVFSALRRECEKLIDTRKRLPDFVFQRSFDRYFAIEHAHIYRKEFGSFLSKLSTIFKDQTVNYMLIDPAPADRFPRDSFFGLASFQPESLIERYVPVMSVRSIVSLAVLGNVGAFWGSSLGWAISCDRISWEMDVIALSGSVDVPSISGFRCMDASILSGYIQSQYRVKDPSNSIASDFARRFLTNYPV